MDSWKSSPQGLVYNIGDHRYQIILGNAALVFIYSKPAALSSTSQAHTSISR